jgi:4-hydroxy-3-methylbut-2-enyl diphosphate reductase
MEGRPEEVLIAAPMRLEATLISRAAKEALVERTGTGPARARYAAAGLAARPASALVVVGFAGGLDRQATPGEVIVATDVFSAFDEGHREERVTCELAGQLLTLLAGLGLKLRTGSIVCVSRPAPPQRRAELLATGALAVDTESVWLAAGSAGRPFGVVRVVLDGADAADNRPRYAGGALRAGWALRRVAAALEGWRAV